MRQVLATLHDQKRQEPLTTTAQVGEGSTPDWHMMQHAVDHSTYHRGHIVTRRRQLRVALRSAGLIRVDRDAPMPQHKTPGDRTASASAKRRQGR